MPVGVGREDQVPDGEGAEVDEHPENVRKFVGCDDDEDARKAENESQEDERNDWGSGVQNCCFDGDNSLGEVSIPYCVVFS